MGQHKNIASRNRISLGLTQTGFTMVELMVALVIGLIGMLIITETLIVNERFKRSSVSAGDAQTNGALSLSAIERDVRMAGAGIAHSQILGCNPLQFYWDQAPLGPIYSKPANPTSTLPSFTIAPAVIEEGGGNPDSITIMYANEGQRLTPGRLRSNMANGTSDLKLDEVAGFATDNVVIVSQSATCTMMQVTQVELGSAISLHHSPTGTNYNPPVLGSLFPAYTTGALVFNMGKPVVRRYEITNGSLFLTNYFEMPAVGNIPVFNNTAQLIYNNIVDFQAQYGKDNGAGGGTAGDGIIDEYDSTSPTTSLGWQQVLAVRIGLLARSTNREKGSGSPSVCTATTVIPTWLGGNLKIPEGVPSCFKYRVFETVVPLRNMMWRES